MLQMQSTEDVVAERIRTDIAGLYFKPDAPLLRSAAKDAAVLGHICVGYTEMNADKPLNYLKEVLYEGLRQWSVMEEKDRFQYWNDVAGKVNEKFKFKVPCHAVRSITRSLLRARQLYLARQPERHEHDVSNMTTAAAQLLLDKYKPEDPTTLSPKIDDLVLMTDADKKEARDAMVLVGPTRKISGSSWSLTAQAPQRLHLIGELSVDRKSQDLMGFVRRMTTDRPSERSPSSIARALSEPMEPIANEEHPYEEGQISATPTKAKPARRRVVSQGDRPLGSGEGEEAPPLRPLAPLALLTPVDMESQNTPVSATRLSASVSPNIAIKTSPFDTPGRETEASPPPSTMPGSVKPAGMNSKVRAFKRDAPPAAIGLTGNNTNDKDVEMADATPELPVLKRASAGIEVDLTDAKYGQEKDKNATQDQDGDLKMAEASQSAVVDQGPKATTQVKTQIQDDKVMTDVSRAPVRFKIPKTNASGKAKAQDKGKGKPESKTQDKKKAQEPVKNQDKAKMAEASQQPIPTNVSKVDEVSTLVVDPSKSSKKKMMMSEAILDAIATTPEKPSSSGTISAGKVSIKPTVTAEQQKNEKQRKLADWVAKNVCDSSNPQSSNAQLSAVSAGKQAAGPQQDDINKLLQNALASNKGSRPTTWKKTEQPSNADLVQQKIDQLTRNAEASKAGSSTKSTPAADKAAPAADKAKKDPFIDAKGRQIGWAFNPEVISLDPTKFKKTFRRVNLDEEEKEEQAKKNKSNK